MIHLKSHSAATETEQLPNSSFLVTSLLQDRTRNLFAKQHRYNNNNNNNNNNIIEIRIQQTALAGCWRGICLS